MAIVAACGRLRGRWLSLQVHCRRLIHTASTVAEGAYRRWLFGESPGLVVHGSSVSAALYLTLLWAAGGNLSVRMLVST